MKIRKLGLFQPFFLLAFAASGEAAVTLYSNPFLTPGGGNGGGTNYYFEPAMASAGWQAWSSNNGTGTGEIAVATLVYENRHSQPNANVFITDRRYPGTPAGTPPYGMLGMDSTGGSNKFVFTNLAPIDSTTPELTFNWTMGNSSTTLGVRIAIQMDGQWYASTSFNTTTAVSNIGNYELGTNVEVKNLVFNPAASNWTLINFSPGEAPLSLGGAATSDLTGDITGVGFFAPNGAASGNIRISDFNITGVPEPSVSLLGAVGALGLLRRRRNG